MGGEGGQTLSLVCFKPRKCVWDCNFWHVMGWGSHWNLNSRLDVVWPLLTSHNYNVGSWRHIQPGLTNAPLKYGMPFRFIQINSLLVASISNFIGLTKCRFPWSYKHSLISSFSILPSWMNVLKMKRRDDIFQLPFVSKLSTQQPTPQH